MKEREEGKTSGLRRAQDEDPFADDDSPQELTAQSLESLKEGYSWVRAMQSRHPGWIPFPVEGFPFSLPLCGLADARVCLVSLAGIYLHGQKPFNISPGVVPSDLRRMRFRDQGDWSVREIPAGVESAELAVAHAHYDHSEADEDINCVFPLARLVELAEEGFVAEAAGIHYSLMGYVPAAANVLHTARTEIIPGLKRQGVDVVLISGGCELSHQSAALMQREIEAAGIPTVGVTLCRDITYHMQVPRAAALRFPLGNPFGASMDVSMQSRILRDALALVESVTAPGEILDLPYEWTNG